MKRPQSVEMTTTITDWVKYCKITRTTDNYNQQDYNCQARWVANDNLIVYKIIEMSGLKGCQKLPRHT